MKIAFHFEVKNINPYNFYFDRIVFSVLNGIRNLNLSSKIFVGDLLLNRLAYEESEKSTKQNQKLSFNEDKYLIIIEKWLNPENTIWKNFTERNVIKAINNTPYVICFENIDLSLVEQLNKQLEDIEHYLGALQVDECSPIHWSVYNNSLIPGYRLTNTDKLYIFWDGIDESSKDYGLKTSIEKLNIFNDVTFESLNGRYTIFDEYHNFEQARRIAEWKKKFGSFMAFIADNIINQLDDVAPEIGDKLWAALKTFEDSETKEQYAQVAASCRRLFEYVTDCIFPAKDGAHKGHTLKQNQYRNRLLAFADAASKSNTNIDLIIASTDKLNDQIEKLANLTNKGVHANLYKHEVRRILIRTILLLDDIISLKENNFEIKPRFSLDRFLWLFSKE